MLPADGETTEDKLLHTIKHNVIQYARDIPGTIFSRVVKGLNMHRLGGILPEVKRDNSSKYGTGGQGIWKPMLYLGMWASIFCWHKEDSDMYSISFLHRGANKHWQFQSTFFFVIELI